MQPLRNHRSQYILSSEILLLYSSCYVFIFYISIHTAIRIGFPFTSYTYFEPNFQTPIFNVTIIKEGNAETEQTLSIAITYTDDSATLAQATAGNYDYFLGGAPGENVQLREIPPNIQTTSISFFLLPDLIPEGTESFTIITVQSQGSPAIEAPITIFSSTRIDIIDNDCKCLSHLYLLFIFSALLGMITTK